MSEHNESRLQGSEPPIEGWYITAYALGELDDDSRKAVDAWLEAHPEGLREIEAIRQTATSIEQELAQVSQSTRLDSTRSQRVQEAIAGATNRLPETNSQVDSSDSDLRVARRRRILLAVTSGIAAGLTGVALWVNKPGIQIRSGTSVLFNDLSTTLPTDDSWRALDESNSGAPMPLKNDSGLKNLQADKAIDGLAAGGGSGSVAQPSLPTLIPQASEGRASGLAAAPTKLEPERFARSGDLGLMGGGGKGSTGGQDNSGNASLPTQRRQLYLESQAAKRQESETVRLADGAVTSDRLKRDSSGEFPEELKQNVPSIQKKLRDENRATGDRFDTIPEVPFVSADKEPLSTFSIDVDTASYSKLRQYVLENNVVPPASAIRIEEWLNYFDYQYPGPQGDDPFVAHMKMGDCPWNAKHKVVRVAIQAKKIANEERPKSNLVFLIDVSGSMKDANKLPLVKRTLSLLTSQLREEDRVAIVVYAGASGCVLPSISGSQKDQILASINELQSGGSTNGGQGIELAYKIAKENFIPGGVNRVLLCTDGDFNVGVTGTDALVAMMQEQAKSNVFFTCLGYGIGNYNDSMMEQISNKGNGTYAMIDNETEARRVMTDQLSGTLMTVAKDVKIQVEFNPAKVHSYRLIGYENRRLAAADFNNDKKDAGEIGAGHRVTALYEIVPVGQEDGIPGSIDELRYSKLRNQSQNAPATDSEPSKDWLLLKIRSKQPEASQSTKQEFVLGEEASSRDYEGQQSDFDWALSVAEFGLLMRQSQLAPQMSWEKMLARAMDSTAMDPYRRECIEIMQRAKSLSGN